MQLSVPSRNKNLDINVVRMVARPGDTGVAFLYRHLYLTPVLFGAQPRVNTLQCCDMRNHPRSIRGSLGGHWRATLPAISRHRSGIG